MVHKAKSNKSASRPKAVSVQGSWRYRAGYRLMDLSLSARNLDSRSYVSCRPMSKSARSRLQCDNHEEMAFGCSEHGTFHLDI